MWKLLIFFVLNGQPHLGLIDTSGPTDCQAKLQEMLEEAKKASIPFAAKCEQIKIA